MSFAKVEVRLRVSGFGSFGCLGLRVWVSVFLGLRCLELRVNDSVFKLRNLEFRCIAQVYECMGRGS